MGKFYYNLGKKWHSFRSKLRFKLIRGSFLFCGKNVVVDEDVVFEHPEKIRNKKVYPKR